MLLTALRAATRRLTASGATLAALLAVFLLAACTDGGREVPQTGVDDRTLATRLPRPPEVPDREVLRPRPQEADKVVVVKALRELRLIADGRIFRTYRVALGRNPVGDKLKEGDGRTPEGQYTLSYKNERSRYHRSIKVSYPNAADLEEARALGVDPGSDIMIHGLGPDRAFLGKTHLAADWTEGCIAVTNDQMNEIWELVPVGTPIEIRP
jgi:murein L,D-transpeptidase YafK